MEDKIKTKNKAQIIFSIILPLLSFNHNSVSGDFCPDGLLNLAAETDIQPVAVRAALFLRVLPSIHCHVNSSAGETPQQRSFFGTASGKKLRAKTAKNVPHARQTALFERQQSGFTGHGQPL
jgi:hypothetical protein